MIFGILGSFGIEIGHPIFFVGKFFGSPISIPNDLKIPKITLRTACDQYKNTNSAREKSLTFILLYFPSGGSQVRVPSVQ